MERRTGVKGRLLARRDEPATWMEVYEGVDDASDFGRALDALAARHGVLAFVEDGRRHTERFAAREDRAGLAHVPRGARARGHASALTPSLLAANRDEYHARPAVAGGVVAP
jgi:hypothetical protein